MIEWISWLSIVGMAQAEGDGPQSLFGSPIFLVVMIVIMFYFILYKPERTRKKEREKMLKGLTKGDEVVTSGGIHGRITALTDNVITIEVAQGVRIRVGRSFVSGAVPKESKDKDGKDKDGKDKESGKEKSKKKGK